MLTKNLAVHNIQSIPPHGRGTHSTPTIYYLPSSLLNPPSDNDRRLPDNRYSSLESPTKDTKRVGPIHIGLPSSIGKPQNKARGYWRDPETCYLSPPQRPQTSTISMLSKNYTCHLLSPSKPVSFLDYEIYGRAGSPLASPHTNKNTKASHLLSHG